MAKKLFGVVIAAVLLAVPTSIFAQEQLEPETTIGLGDVGQGSLLFQTEYPGTFRLGPGAEHRGGDRGAWVGGGNDSAAELHQPRR